MDQGLIEKIKRIYRKQLLRRLLLAEKDEESVVQFITKLNVKDSIYMLADAWETLTKSNLQRAWRKLWPDEESRIEENANENEDCVVNEVTEICSTIPGFEPVSYTHLRQIMHTACLAKIKKSYSRPTVCLSSATYLQTPCQLFLGRSKSGTQDRCHQQPTTHWHHFRHTVQILSLIHI